MMKNIDLTNLTISQGFSITGAATGVKSGYSVSSAGDFNGDGYNDIIIGAPGYNQKSQVEMSHAGISYIIFGKESNFNNINLANLAITEGFAIIGTAWNSIGDGNGYSVSGAGDLNGDGYDDVIMGAPSKFADQGTKGAAYVIFGNPQASNINIASLTNAQGFIFNGNGQQQSSAGYSVGGNGDIDNDGYDDVVVVDPVESAIYSNNFYSACYVLFSSQIKLSNTGTISVNAGFPTESGPATGFKITGSNQIGISTAKIAGDINNDGYSDIIIGSISANAVGATYVIYGKAAGGYLRLEDLMPHQGFKIDNYFDYSGYAASGVGDFNSDGYDDIIIGSPYANGGKGTAYVIFGSAVGVNIDLHNLHLTQGFSIKGSKNKDNLGYSVSHAGDVNGDGYDDVIIGAPNALLGKGISYVIYGKPNNIVNIDLAYLKESQGFSILGASHSVSGAGDINKDGFDDVIIGSPSQNSDAGKSYVIFGALSDTGLKPAPKTVAPSIYSTAIPTIVGDPSDLVSSSPTPLIFSPVPVYATVDIKFGGLYEYTDDILGSGNFIIDSPTNAALTTGSGADMFTIMPHAGVVTTITNFDPSCEIIDLSNFAKIHNINDLSITNKNAAIIMLPNGEEIRLLNLQSEDISPGNFVFSPDIHENHNGKNEELSYGAVAGIVTAGILFTAFAGYMVYAKSFHQWPFTQSFIGLSDSEVETSAY